MYLTNGPEYIKNYKHRGDERTEMRDTLEEMRSLRTVYF